MKSVDVLSQPFGISWQTAHAGVGSREKKWLLHGWCKQVLIALVTDCMLFLIFLQTSNSTDIPLLSTEVFLHKLRTAVPLWDFVCMSAWHPAAAVSFMQVSSCPGKLVLDFWTLSEQVQWFIFQCISSSNPFSLIFYFSSFSFPSFQPQGMILTYPNCNLRLCREQFLKRWGCVSPSRVRGLVGKNHRHRSTCGWRIRRSLSADSQLSFWQHFRE